MATHSFQLKPNDMEKFIEFSEGDPYYLDFSEGGQSGTVSWSQYSIPWAPIAGGFEVTYKKPDDDLIVEHIQKTVAAFDGEKEHEKK